MTTSPSHPQDTTVALPNVSLAGMRQLVRQLIQRQPEAAARIQRGLALLLSQPIAATGETGTYAVPSCADAGRTYFTTTLGCTCPDAQRHLAQRCKHAWAITLLHAASVVARWEAVTPDPDDDPPPSSTRYTLTSKGAAVVAQAPGGPLTRRLAEAQLATLRADWARRQPTEVA